MMMGGYWEHGALAVMAVVGAAWMRVAARPGMSLLPDGRREGLPDAEPEERRLADVLAFPAPKLREPYEVFAERARLLG
jgi:hypothetical protein